MKEQREMDGERNRKRQRERETDTQTCKGAEIMRDRKNTDQEIG